MFRKLFVILCTITIFCLSSMSASAEPESTSTNPTVTIDLRMVDSQLAKQILEAIKEKDSSSSGISLPSGEEALEWANIGKHIGLAVAETAKALSVEVNEFVKTPVGMFAMAIIFWYVFGATLWSIVGGAAFWIVMTAVLWSLHRKFVYLEEVEDGGKKMLRSRMGYTGDSERMGVSVIFLILFVVETIVALLLVF